MVLIAAAGALLVSVVAFCYAVGMEYDSWKEKDELSGFGVAGAGDSVDDSGDAGYMA